MPVPAEKMDKVDGEVQDGGAPVVEPEAKGLIPTDVHQKMQKKLVVMHNRKVRNLPKNLKRFQKITKVMTR